MNIMPDKIVFFPNISHLTFCYTTLLFFASYLLSFKRIKDERFLRTLHQLKHIYNCWTDLVLRLVPTGETVMKQWWNSDEAVMKQWWNSDETVMKQWWNSDETVMKQVESEWNDESLRWNSDETCWIRMNQQLKNLFHGRETPWNMLNQDESAIKQFVSWSSNTVQHVESGWNMVMKHLESEWNSVFHGHETPWIRMKQCVSWNTLFHGYEIPWICFMLFQGVSLFCSLLFHGVSRCFISLFHAFRHVSLLCFKVFHCSVSRCFKVFQCLFHDHETALFHDHETGAVQTILWCFKLYW